MNLARIDHLVVATPDIDQAVNELERQLGASMDPGGQHPAWGTCNRILPLGPSVYLEVIGPDPTASPAKAPTIFGLDRVVSTSLVTWALKASDLRAMAQEARAHFLPVGSPLPGRRVRDDGSELSWMLSDPAAIDPNSLVPFLIEWSSPHPAAGWSGAVELLALEGEHPRPDQVTGALASLGVDMPVTRGERPGLIATLRGPKGEVQLRR